MNGGKSLAQVCGARWPRLLLPTWAAARVSMMLPEFRASSFGKLIRLYDGRERVDLFELDAMIDEMTKKAAAKTAGEAN